MNVSRRVAARVARDYREPVASQVIGLLAALDLPSSSSAGDERVCGAILLLADGDLDRLVDAAALAETDWRDVLVGAGLANDDWRERLDALLASRE